MASSLAHLSVSFARPRYYLLLTPIVRRRIGQAGNGLSISLWQDKALPGLSLRAAYVRDRLNRGYCHDHQCNRHQRGEYACSLLKTITDQAASGQTLVKHDKNTNTNAPKRMSMLELLRSPNIAITLYIYGHIMILAFSYTAIVSPRLSSKPKANLLYLGGLSPPKLTYICRYLSSSSHQSTLVDSASLRS